MQRLRRDLIALQGCLADLRNEQTTSRFDGEAAQAALAMMLTYSVWLTAIVIGAAMVYALVRCMLYHPLRQAQEEEISKGARQHSHFLETARGIQGVKHYGRQVLRRSQYEDLLADQFNAGTRVQRLGII